MSVEVAFLIVLGLCLLLSVAVIFYLKRPLHYILRDLCGSDDRARFWTACSNVVLVLVPLAAVMLGRAAERSSETVVFLIADQVKWAIMGLIVAVFVIALGVATFILPWGTRLVISSTQADDLQRLLAKVEEIRAREILSRAANVERN